MAEADSWREKYLSTLERIEADETRWKALEDILRRLVGRLCIAARGMDEGLDRELNRLSQAMRRQAGFEEIETLMVSLSDAIAGMDQKDLQSAAAESAPAKLPEKAPEKAAETADGKLAAKPADTPLPGAPINARIDALLARMLEQLSQFPELQARISALSAPSVGERTIDEVAERLHEAADLVQELLARLRREKGDVENMVKQFTTQLDAIAGYLRGDALDRKAGQEASQQLNTRVLGEVSAIGTQVSQAANIEDLRVQLRSRLDTINGHMQEFQVREQARTLAWRERAEQMRVRVVELERKTTTLQQSLRKEQHLAMTDALTGIANRLAYEERIAQDFQRWQQHHRPITIAAWDIDKFKSINDRFGHTAGDKVLQLVAQHLARSIRSVDFVARYGGEEFVMILDSALLPEGQSIVEKLRQSIAKLGFHFRGEPVSITISCGLTELREGDNSDTAFERADRCLYEAKNGGRNRSVAV